VIADIRDAIAGIWDVVAGALVHGKLDPMQKSGDFVESFLTVA
jgi:hypothetical protein